MVDIHHESFFSHLPSHPDCNAAVICTAWGYLAHANNVAQAGQRKSSGTASRFSRHSSYLKRKASKKNSKNSTAVSMEGKWSVRSDRTDERTTRRDDVAREVRRRRAKRSATESRAPQATPKSNLVIQPPRKKKKEDSTYITPVEAP